MPPIGEYSNFADCVKKNKDKKDPKAYCGTIEHNIKEAREKKKDMKKERLTFPGGE